MGSNCRVRSQELLKTTNTTSQSMTGTMKYQRVKQRSARTSFLNSPNLPQPLNGTPGQGGQVPAVVTQATNYPREKDIENTDTKKSKKHKKHKDRGNETPEERAARR